jgi:hypothetical protein
MTGREVCAKQVVRAHTLGVRGESEDGQSLKTPHRFTASIEERLRRYPVP